jgi:hypothetical protein
MTPAGSRLSSQHSSDARHPAVGVDLRTHGAPARRELLAGDGDGRGASGPAMLDGVRCEPSPAGSHPAGCDLAAGSGLRPPERVRGGRMASVAVPCMIGKLAGVLTSRGGAATESRGLRGWGRRGPLCHPAVVSAGVMAAGAIVWIVVFPRVGTDLSAAVARAGWASRYPGSAYLFSWYGGIYPAGYSVLAPWLFALAGTRLVMAAAAVACAGLLSWLLTGHGVPRPRAAALWAAVALWTDLSAGRGAFIVGLAAALGCVVAAGRGRPCGCARWLAVAALAMAAGLLSPVAGLFLGVPAAVFVLTGRTAEGVVMGVAAALPVGVTALVPGSGAQPIEMGSWLPSLLAAAGVVALVPRRWQAVRVGAVSYGVGVIAAWAVQTPVGSNVERLGLLLAGPLVAGMGSSRHRPLLALALIAAAAWQVTQPAEDLAQGNAPPYAPQTAALVHELRAVHADTARVEAVPQYGHWESQQLASTVWLARGWQRQIDIARNPLFYGGALTPAAYDSWLRYDAVRYVAISTGTPDWAATAEAAIVRAGQPWLVPVWHDSYWQLYQVAATEPLASAPATVVTTSPAEITLQMSRPGVTIVRVHWSPLLRSTGGAIVAPHGAWTSLATNQAGTYTLTAPY